jgi:hypothetical protein
MNARDVSIKPAIQNPELRRKPFLTIIDAPMGCEISSQAEDVQPRLSFLIELD